MPVQHLAWRGPTPDARARAWVMMPHKSVISAEIRGLGNLCGFRQCLVRDGAAWDDSRKPYKRLLQVEVEDDCCLCWSPIRRAERSHEKQHWYPRPGGRGSTNSSWEQPG